MSRHRDRSLEWLLACLQASFGITIVVLPDVFVAPQYRGFNRIGIDEDIIGAIMMMVGLVWCLGLWINGSWRRSPLLRLGCAILGATIWGGIEAAFLASTPSPGVALGAVVTVFSIIACARCGADATHRPRSRRVDGNAELDA